MMLISLILPLLVTAEWVEISQNHYRKEPNYRHSYIQEKTTAAYNIYNNHSSVHHQWSKGYVQRIPGLSIKQLQESGNESLVKNEINTFRRHELTTQKPGLKTEVTQWKSGNALIERLDHRHIPHHHHHTTPATTNPLQQLSNINTSENLLNIYGNNDEVIETVNSVQNSYMDKKDTKDLRSESQFTSTQNVFDESVDEESTKIIDNKQTITHTNNKTILKDNEFINDSNKSEQTSKHKGKEKIKINTMETLMKFLKVVSQTINQSAQRSFNGKVRYLEGLKESLLRTIEERIDSAFPDDNDEQQRHRRASGADTHGHVDFPSSESALMTISFLTFAVFLIKLVLQVIHTYKAKTMMVTPAVVATVGRAATIIKKSTQN